MPVGTRTSPKTKSGPDFRAWAKGRREARFTDWLRELSEPHWTQAVEHRFTRELADGTLSDAVFQRYLVQDYSFVDRFVSLIGFAIGHAPRLAERIRLVRFLAGVTSTENTYFKRSFDALAVPEQERSKPKLATPTRGFHALMRQASQTGGYGEVLAVLVVAEWLYLSWAMAVRDRSPEKFYFAEWISLHANEEFRDFVEWLRGQLDRVGPALPAARRMAVVRLFRRAVRLERDFFDAAYRA